MLTFQILIQKITNSGDIRNIQEGENLPGYLSPVKVRKGIEVGHIFQLGDKYSKALNAAFQNKDGKNQNPIMGCYGIGVSRIMAASIEQIMMQMVLYGPSL